MKNWQVSSVAAAIFLMGSSLSAPAAAQVASAGANPDIGGGKVLFYTTTGDYRGAANVGNLPDMVMFSSEGTTVVSANEGEPADDYSTDPGGSISIISLNTNSPSLINSVTTLDFKNVLVPDDVRIKPGSSPEQDLEPEYVAINEEGTKAWVSLQENNALAIVDLQKKQITEVVSLGIKQFDRIDIDSKDGANVAPAPANVFGLYQPDTIVSYQVDGKEYIVSANEGDDREYGAWEDYEKAYKLIEKGERFSEQLREDILSEKGKKKLRVLKDLGKDENGTYTALYLAGTRSFSIWESNGKQVYDSGSDFEEHLATTYPAHFNTRVDDTDDKEDIAELKKEQVPYEMVGDSAYFWEGVDARSQKKGCEPEALALASIAGKVYAYIGLEKQGGFFVYDISDPRNPVMIEYFNDIDYDQLPTASGDLAPEGMVTFEQDGKHYLAVANELSSTISLYSLGLDGKAEKTASLQTGSFDQGAAEIIAYSNGEKKLFVTNGEKKTVDIVDVSTPAQPQKTGTIDFSSHADALQSVAVKNGLVAIAVDRK